MKHLLEDLGYNYSLASIVNSELRVFKYLGYRLLIPNPYSFFCALSESLVLVVKDVDANYLYTANLMILECFYCSREKIYDKLYETLTGRTKDTSNNGYLI